MMNKVTHLDIPIKTILHLYQSIVHPVLVYGSDVWDVSSGGTSEVGKAIGSWDSYYV